MQSRQKLQLASSSKEGVQRKRSSGRRSIQEMEIKPLHESAAHGVIRSRSPPRRSRSRAAAPAHFEHPVNYYSLSEYAALGSMTRQTPQAPVFAKAQPSSSSNLISAAEIEQERQRAHLSIQLSVPAMAHQAPVLQTARLVPARAAPSRLARLKAMFESFVRRLLAFFFPRKADMRTARGQAALAQLQTLRNLLFAEVDDSSMDLVAFQAAFGTAYYQVLQASREHYKRHKGKEGPTENYQSYFEDFLRAMP